MIDEPIGRLLTRLSAERADSAWAEFLERFSPLIMHVVRRYETDAGRATDSFIHVCGELSNNGFRRLLRFRPDGTARFQTWLSAVVSNLCVDWRRQQHGRYRPIQSVARLPELDQLVYRYVYVRGMPREECLHALRARFPDLTEKRLSEVNGRLFALLTPRQRWQLSTRAGETVPLDDAPSPDSDTAAFQPEEPGPGPDELAQTDQERSLLETAMARLLPQQRLLLRLRYQQDLTLEEIARLTGLPDPFRANRQIQAALEALAEIVKSQPPASEKRRDVSV
jgi:RNA polymerase sigma factor (sigma-70 family)